MKNSIFTLALVTAIALALGACSGKSTVGPEETIGPSKGVYIFNGSASTISIFDIEKKTIANNVIQLGKYPNDIVIQEDVAYVVNSGDNSIQIINLDDNKTVGLINVGDGTNPWQIALSDQKTAYVSALMTDSVVKVDVGGRKAVNTIKVGPKPAGIVAYKEKIYVVNSNAVFDLATQQMSYGKGTISIINSKTDNVIKTIDVGLNPQYLAIDDNSGRLHVVCSGNYADTAGQVYVIDTNSDAVVKQIDVGGTPGRIAIAPNGKVFLGSNYGGILVYNGSDYSVIHSAVNPIKDTAGTDGLAVDADGTLYACVPDWSGSGKDKLLAINSETEALLGTYTPGGGAQGLAIRR